MTSSEIFDLVLLVEDDPGHALIVKRALKHFAHEILHAVSIGEALKFLQTARPDLLILDLHLPDSQGVSDIERITAAAGGMPVVVLTSSTAWREVKEAMRCGAQDYIVKNFDDDFKEVLGFALSRVYADQARKQESLLLRRQMEFLRTAIENSHDGLAVSNGNGEITYSNRAFREFVKRCGGEAGSIFCLLPLSDDVQRNIQESITRHFRTLPVGASWHTEIDVPGETAAAFDINLSVLEGSPVEAQGDRTGVVWVRDVSELRRREKFQREILSATTHDLKGPLSAILLSAGLLEDMLDHDSKAFELVLRIASSAQGGINQIDEFLSARRIQEGAFILKPSRQRILPLVEQVLSDFRAIAEARRTTLEVEVAADCEGIVDRVAFCRVLSNLLSNALKFTARQGHVWVAVGALKDGLELKVRDDGSGIEAADIQRIFGRFSRLERHQDIAGSGIGLFVVKSLVQAHGGKIEVISQVGKGTTFQVTFPSAPPVDAHGELISLDFS